MAEEELEPPMEDVSVVAVSWENVPEEELEPPVEEGPAVTVL